MQKLATRAVTLALLLTSLSCLSQGSQNLAKLQLELLNPKQLEGQLFIAVHKLPEDLSVEQTWDELPMTLQLNQVLHKEDKTLLISVAELPAGRYAIRLFVDENSNQELDLSALGVPKEAVGFSNNPSLFSGIPQVSDTAFYLNEAKLSLMIRLVKHKPKKQKHLKL